MITQQYKLWKKIKKGYQHFIVEKTSKEMLNTAWLPYKVIDGDTNSNIYKFLTTKYDCLSNVTTCNVNEVKKNFMIAKNQK